MTVGNVSLVHIHFRQFADNAKLPINSIIMRICSNSYLITGQNSCKYFDNRGNSCIYFDKGG